MGLTAEQKAALEALKDKGRARTEAKEFTVLQPKEFEAGVPMVSCGVFRRSVEVETRDGGTFTSLEFVEVDVETGKPKTLRLGLSKSLETVVLEEGVQAGDVVTLCHLGQHKSQQSGHYYWKWAVSVLTDEEVDEFRNIVGADALLLDAPVEAAQTELPGV